VAPQVLEGWDLQLVPDAAAIEGISRQIRSRAKAYPLFELARIILQLSDRYKVKLRPREEGTAPELFRAKLDGSLWTSRKEAISHVLAKHLDSFYRRSSVTVEPPKGAFTVVAQCGMSGVIIGPPNHHEYTTKVIGLHAARFRNMPFETFKSRIRMVRDEALIEQWKTEQSTKTVYIPVTPGEEQAPAATPLAEPVSQEETAEVVGESVGESAEPVPSDTIAIPENTTGESPSPEPVAVGDEGATAASESPASEGEASVPTDESAAEGTEEQEQAPQDASPAESGFTLQEATAHFHEHHAGTEIEPAQGEILIEGKVALHESTPLLRELLLQNLREMDRFPLPLAQAVGKELSDRGIQLFKSHKKIIHASVARPRYLDREANVIGENFRAILDYLEAHPKQHRDKQWAALLALRTETSDAVPAETETPAEQPVAAEPQETEGTEGALKTTPVQKPAIDEATLKRREQALGADLLWLLHQGHVIDFAMGNLQAATKPVPKAPPTPKKEKSKKESGAVPESLLAEASDETLTGDLDEVQTGGSATLPSEHSEDVITEPVEHHEPLEIPEGTVLETPPPVDPGEFLPKE
jgi:hypothetical protein